MKFISLTLEQDYLIQQAAQILVDAFKTHWPEAWPTLEDGLDEVREMLATDRILRVALDSEGNVAGWIGGIPHYDGHVWELHPLAVKTELQGKGFNSVAVISAIISLVALVLSITFLVFQKRASIYSTLGLIISILFICASLMLGYGNTLSFPENLYTGQISSGVGGMGFGLALMTLSIISFDLNKSGLTSNLKYSKALMVWVFICGIFIFAFGIYMFVLGCQYLLNG